MKTLLVYLIIIFISSSVFANEVKQTDAAEQPELLRIVCELEREERLMEIYEELEQNPSVQRREELLREKDKLISKIYGTPLKSNPAQSSPEKTKGEFSTFESLYLQKGMFNGHAWNKIPEREKMSYLLGYEDGLINTAIQYIPEEHTKEKVISSLPTSIGQVSLDKLVKEIDQFYKDDKNLNIPVPYTLLIIRNLLAGVEEKEINNYITYLHENF